MYITTTHAGHWTSTSTTKECTSNIVPGNGGLTSDLTGKCARTESSSTNQLRGSLCFGNKDYICQKLKEGIFK